MENKIAVLGGSFDPVHLGHLHLLNYAMTQTSYNLFFLIPAKQSNFKRDSFPQASDEQRLQMLNLAIKDYERLFSYDAKTNSKKIIVSDMEIKRGGISFTSDTIMEIKKAFNLNDRVGLIIGDDHLETLNKWHNFDYLKDNVEFIICKRKNNDMSSVISNLANNLCYRLLTDTEMHKENSTALRNNFKSFEDYLSPEVLSYIKANCIYNQ